jgi:hypothetical protein
MDDGGAEGGDIEEAGKAEAGGTKAELGEPPHDYFLPSPCTVGLFTRTTA